MSKKIEIPDCNSCNIRKCSFFCDLTTQQIIELSNHKSSNLYKKGQSVFFEGSRPTGLFCVHSGKVKLSKLRTGGKEQIVRLVKQGDILGYRSLISDELYSATAEVIDDSLICYLPKVFFFDIIKENANMSLKLMQLLASDLKKSEEKMANLAQKQVKERLAETLLMLNTTYGTEQDNKTINVLLSRNDLASIVGTTTETLIRTLTDFKDHNLIVLQGKKIKILNKNRLIHIANIFGTT